MCKACDKMMGDANDGTYDWSRPIDPVALAKYQRAKRTGKIPADPIYAAHVRASWHIPNLEFTRAELADKSVKVFKRDQGVIAQNPAKADRFFPDRSVTDTASYVRVFEKLNNLKRTA